MGGLLDSLKPQTRGRIQWQVEQSEARIAEYRRQQIVEVVRDAARQHPQALETLSLLPLFHELLPALLRLHLLGDVLTDFQYVAFATGTQIGSRNRFDPDPAPVLMLTAHRGVVDGPHRALRRVPILQ